MTNSSGVPTGPLDQRPGLGNGAVLALVAMVGAGLFSSFAPAAATAGPRLVLAVAVAAVVAALGAHSLVGLETAHPTTQGVYVHGRERLGLPWGHLAGWAFVMGTVAASAAMALTIGAHLWPDLGKPIAVFAVLCVLALDLQGVRRSRRLARAAVLALIVLVVIFGIVMLAAPPVTADAPPPARPGSGSVTGVLQAAGFLFFAFAGLSLTTTTPPEDDPSSPRTARAAAAVALSVTFGLYVLVAVALTDTLGAGWVAARVAPIPEAAEISSWPWLGPALRIACVIVVGGALLALVRRTTSTVVELARDRHLPHQLATVDGPLHRPRRATTVIAVLVILLVIVIDLGTAIALSSFFALVYSAIAHASAWTLGGLAHRLVPVLGLLTCVLVGALLPWPTLVFGVGVLALGAFVGWARWTTREGRAHP